MKGQGGEREERGKGREGKGGDGRKVREGMRVAPTNVKMLPTRLGGGSTHTPRKTPLWLQYK